LLRTARNNGLTFKASHSGNPKGQSKRSRNQQTQAVTDRLEALGCDPIEGTARIATDEAADIKHLGTDVAHDLGGYMDSHPQVLLA
jgi:hypothetical protein